MQLGSISKLRWITKFHAAVYVFSHFPLHSKYTL